MGCRRSHRAASRRLSGRRRARRCLRHRQRCAACRESRRQRDRSRSHPRAIWSRRELADQAGVWIELLEGDAENLPFEDESFDAVVSTFGHMFAPRHRIAAAEIARVLRPGGRFGLTAWTPEGNGRILHAARRVHSRPTTVRRATGAVGTITAPSSMFGGSGVELQFKRESIRPPEFETPEARSRLLDDKVRSAGPGAQPPPSDNGNWPLLRERLLGYYASRRAARVPRRARAQDR